MIKIPSIDQMIPGTIFLMKKASIYSGGHYYLGKVIKLDPDGVGFHAELIGTSWRGAKSKRYYWNFTRRDYFSLTPGEVVLWRFKLGY